MFALIFTLNARPMIIGSSSGWLMFAGMMARPRATSAAHELDVEAFAQRDELHLRRDLAAPRVVHLRDARARLRAVAWFSSAAGISTFARMAALVRRSADRPRTHSTSPRPRSSRAQLRQAGAHVNMPSGPLVSYTRSGGSPPDSEISRIGTRTPRGPST
jgi:hypothetical protein